MTESLPDDLAAFSRLNPEVRLAVQQRWGTEIARSLQAGNADVSIVVEVFNTVGLETRPYRTVRIAVVMQASNPLASVPDMKFADVLDNDLIALESSASIMRLLAAQAVIEERTLQLWVQVRSFEAVCRMVQAGLAAATPMCEASAALVRLRSSAARTNRARESMSGSKVNLRLQYAQPYRKAPVGRALDECDGVCGELSPPASGATWRHGGARRRGGCGGSRGDRRQHIQRLGGARSRRASGLRWASCAIATDRYRSFRPPSARSSTRCGRKR